VLKEKPLTLYQQQKTTKPKIEDVIPYYINGDMKKTALDFVKYLRVNKMSPSWNGANQWGTVSQGKNICYISLGNKSWRKSDYWIINLHLTHIKNYEISIMNEGLEKIVWDNIRYCGHCSGCAPGKNIPISGKEFKGICRDFILFICDPDETMVNDIKKLLEFEKKARNKNKN